MFGHISWETIENMTTWEREFLLEKAMDWVEITSGNKKKSEEQM